MESNRHSMTNLFGQLGLPSEPGDIEAFIEAHRPLAANLKLDQAPFWTTSQAALLREQVLNDADWVGIIDQLDSGLRQAKTEGNDPA